MAAWSVWTEPMLIDKPQPSYNPATKPTTIALKGAKNEWVGFLICVRGAETLTGFVPSVQSTLTSGANTIADSNVIPYLLFNHTTTERANAYEAPGTYPDAAVPYRDVYYNEVRDGSEAGWGQAVTPNTTRVFFVEVYIPTTTVAGTYTGTFRLTSNSGALTQDIPITIDVWNFTLPEQWSLKNLWGVYGDYWDFDGTAFGGRDDTKAREYLFNMQKAAINHGFFLYGSTGRQTSGPTPADSFTSPYFEGASDTYSWKRFLDGTVPQGYNPKPYPKTSIWATRDEAGGALINKTTTTMDAWADWITANSYNQTTLFFDKIIDEPELSAINTKHEAHVTRHSGHPNRPMEYWTSSSSSYPPDSAFWTDNFKSVWMVSQFYTWYRAHDWGEPYGSPDDFDSRRATYGDLLFSYTAGDNDHDCDRDLSYNVGKNCRAAASSSLDAHSRQNAYMFISDWHFGTEGHHFWMTNEGWNYLVASGTADGAGAFSIQIPKTLREGQYQIYAWWGSGSNRLVGNAIIVSSGSRVSSVSLPSESTTVGPTLTVTGTASAGADVRIFIHGTSAIDSADYVWSTTDPFGDYKLSNNYPLASGSAYNGDGLYFYPGRVSGTNYDIGGTHEIPIESYKLKLVRWGAQVYEYAKLLEANGQKNVADTQVARMITFNVPNTIKINSVQEWEDARNTMGDTIAPSQQKPTIFNIIPRY